MYRFISKKASEGAGIAKVQFDWLITSANQIISFKTSNWQQQTKVSKSLIFSVFYGFKGLEMWKKAS